MTPETLDDSLGELSRRIAPGEDFVQSVMSKLPANEQPQQKKVKRGQTPLFWIGALAAGMALVIGLRVWINRGVADIGHPPTRPEMPVAYERTSSQWRATMQRPVIGPGEVPAFEYRQQEFERVQLVDPASHATLEQVVPRNETTLIVLENY